MEGTLPRSELIRRRRRRVRFELATESDDAEIRRLLRDNPMDGQVALSLEREPNFFADANLPGEEKQTIIARERNRVVCVGSCIIRSRFVGGQPRRVGYLGGLRLDKIVAGRFDIVRGGYEFFHELQGEAPADLYFTSIASDNDRARRFLERGLPGMPRYDFVGEFVTLVLSAGSAARCKKPSSVHTSGAADAPPLDAICDFLNDNNRRYELSPCWSAREVSVLAALGLRNDDFEIARLGERIVGCAALWDQRAFKQTVVRGYAPWLSRLRAPINLVASIARQPQWPRPGATLAHAFISHLAVAPSEPGALTTIITTLAAGARRRNIELLTLGFAADDPRLATVRMHFRHREYRSRIYLVRWPDMITEPSQLRADSLAPEAALL